MTKLSNEQIKTIEICISQFNNVNKETPFELGNGMVFLALLDMYRHSNTFFGISDVYGFIGPIYKLFASSLLFQEFTSTPDVAPDERDLKEAEDVSVNGTETANLFYRIDLLHEYLNQMSSEQKRAKHLLTRSEIESLKKQLEKNHNH